MRPFATSYRRRLQSLAATILLTALALPLAAAEWDLSPTDGNNKDGWAKGANWTWAAENPRLEKEGRWSLAIQAAENPTPTTPYTLMGQGTYVGYFRIWTQPETTAKDPNHQYRGRNLVVRASEKKPHTSAASVLLFRVPRDGTYALNLEATVKVQSPSAGCAQLKVYVLNAARSEARDVATYLLNSPGDNAYGKHPAELKADHSLKLKAGDEIAFQLTAFCPGSATPGTVSLSLDRLHISDAN